MVPYNMRLCRIREISMDSGLSVDFAPDATVDVRTAFGIDQDLEVPAFSQRTDYVPVIDQDYRFDRTPPWPSSPASPTTGG